MSKGPASVIQVVMDRSASVAPSICGQQLGFRVGHSRDAKTGIEISHRLSQAVQIGPFSTYHTVCVLGRTLGPIGRGSRPAA
jgi:hypothetical protein